MGKSGKASVLAVVEMTGPDTRMDQFGNIDKPANPLPVKCPHCTMPDLDFIPSPYLLAKGFASSAEHSPAEVGNFLVRERTRRILELVVPGQCTFVPTAEKKSKKPTPWSLAVPKAVVDIPGMELHDSKKLRCDKCKEPKLGYLGKTRRLHPDKANTSGADIFKSKQLFAQRTEEDSLAEVNKYRKKEGIPLLDWSAYEITEPPHAQRWTRAQLSRDLFFSVRLEQLLKKAKVRGQLVRYTVYDDIQSGDEDLAWIDQKMQLLAEHGLVEGGSRGGKKKPDRQSANRAARWFEQYLKSAAPKNKPTKVDFTPVEKKHKLVLPRAYKDFISIVGPRKFTDVMEQEGFTARILPPSKLDFRDYRRGKWDDAVETDVDGVMFANTDHGDVFVFNVAEKDWPVYWYDHEQNMVEPFAPGFAEAIQRFAERT